MIGSIVATIALVIVVFALLAPLESLRWWAKGQDADTVGSIVHARGEGLGTDLTPDPTDTSADAPRPQRFVVYLSGIGAVDGRTDSRRERAALESLGTRLPEVVIAADVFPYAVGNRGLTQRASTWFWGRLASLQRVPVANLVSNLINLRNGLRVLVSADPRYGPTYNLAVAQSIEESLTRHGYDWTRPDVPVTLIGYSGGGQIAVGAAWYLAATDVPVSVISIGGVLSDDPGLDRVEHVWHLYGSRDRIQRLGEWAFPGRWPTARVSAWHDAVRADRITTTCIGPMRHMGGRDYFDRHVTDSDGVNYRELTVAAIAAAVNHDIPRRTDPR